MTKPTSKLMLPQKNRGFTLIELLVTILILGILTAAGLPSYRSFVVSQRIKSATFDVIASLSLARSEAIKRGVNVDVVPNGGNLQNGWVISFTAAGITTVLKNTSASGGGVAITCYSGTSTTPITCPTITYNSSGRLSALAMPSIQLAANDPSTPSGFAMRCIGVDLSGRPNSKNANCP